MKYRIIHKTHYNYSDAVSLCHNEAHLATRDAGYQKCLNSCVVIEPYPAVHQQVIDYYGNKVDYFALQSPHQILTITAKSEVDVQYPGFTHLPMDSQPWESIRDLLKQPSSIQTSEVFDAREFVLDSPFVVVNEQLHKYALPSFTAQRPILDAVRDLMRRIFTEFKYDPNFTTIVTPLEEVLEHRRGVCQDFAHLMIACVRSMGLAARYISGYLETLPPPGQQKLQGSDASHAWMSVFVPELGWVDFDPTNNQIPTFQHIVTAWGRDYGDVTPLKGVIFGGGIHTLLVSVDVERIGSSEAFI